MDRSFGPAVFVEVCAGSATLSAEAMKTGFQVFPIDYGKNRFRAKASIFLLDLSETSSVGVIQHIIRFCKPDHAHFGLPCGTCSRARDLPVKRTLRMQGAPEPKPLRSGDEPLGLQGLSSQEAKRVELANKVYRTAVAALMECYLLGVSVSIENPERSWIWSVLAALVKETGHCDFSNWYHGLVNVNFDACMHGHTRAKATRLRASAGLFEHLAVRCNGGHRHSSWDVRKVNGSWAFPSAGEAEYSPTLAKRIVGAVAAKVPKEKLQNTAKALRLNTLQAAGKQSKRHLPLIPEFRTTMLGTRPPAALHKLISHEGAASGGEGGASPKVCKFGIFYTPEEHMLAAMELDHPFSKTDVIPDVIRANLFHLFTKGTTAMAKYRCQRIVEIGKLAKNLESRNASLLETLNESVAEVVKGKNLALWEELLASTKFPDMEAARIMREGVHLTGEEVESPLFDQKFKPMRMTPEQLRHQAPLRRMAMLAEREDSHSCSQASVLAKESREEVEAGFLKGPFSSCQKISEELHCNDWSLTRRFFIEQGEKIRTIDNYKESGINEAFGTSSYLALQDTDFLAALLRFISKVCAVTSHVVIPMSDGTVWKGQWHNELRCQPKWWGRCADLSKAYKQIAVHPDSLREAVLGFPVGGGEWEFYISRSLPFGATSSVFSFNKVSRGLWHLLVSELRLITTVFFDDFPILELEPLRHLTSKVIGSFLDLLGWRHATSGKKAADFDRNLVALGVEFGLSEVWEGRFSVANKAGRIEVIESLLSEVREAGAERKSLARLHGLLNFANGQTLGSALKPLSKRVSEVLYNLGDSRDGKLDDLLRMAQCIIPRMVPRLVRATSEVRPCIIYTDGAFEDGTGTWGAILCDTASDARSMVHGTVPPGLIDAWVRMAGEQVICEIEAFAFLMARLHFREGLTDRLGLAFIDNEAARVGLVKRYSPSSCMFNIIAVVNALELHWPFHCWYDRVPSASNPSDLPSRGAAKDACSRFGCRDLGVVEPHAELVTFLSCQRFCSESLTSVLDKALEGRPNGHTFQ